MNVFKKHELEKVMSSVYVSSIAARVRSLNEKVYLSAFGYMCICVLLVCFSSFAS